MEVWRVERNFPYQCKRTDGRGLTAISISVYQLKAQSDRLQSVVTVNDERSNQTRWLRHVVKLWYIQQRTLRSLFLWLYFNFLQVTCLVLSFTICSMMKYLMILHCYKEHLIWWACIFVIYFTVVPSFIVISTNHRHAAELVIPNNRKLLVSI